MFFRPAQCGGLRLRLTRSTSFAEQTSVDTWLRTVKSSPNNHFFGAQEIRGKTVVEFISMYAPGDQAMGFHWWLAVAIAAAIFLALFAFRLIGEPPEISSAHVSLTPSQSFEFTKNNYATAPKLLGPSGQPVGDSQKYEKIATLTEVTRDFDADRKRVDDLISKHQGIVQFERATGLAGRRMLYLGVGVPPDRFDAFIDAAKAIGSNAQVEIIKNDKTNEYLQLRAKRATLEKARAGLDALQASGGSVDERIHVQNRLTEIEERIQELGVSLGEFDSQNELCTVKLTLRETTGAEPSSWGRRIIDALEWASLRYALLGAGFLCLVVGAWLAMSLVRFVHRLANSP
jgi:Domain of unknown function (DUF4349)